MEITSKEKKYLLTVDRNELEYILQGLQDFERKICLCDSPRNKRRISLEGMIEAINNISKPKQIARP